MKGDVAMYTITEDFDKATHWLAEYDEDIIEYDGVIVGKLYPVSYDEQEEEYYVEDENGDLSMIWLMHEGKFVIMG